MRLLPALLAALAFAPAAWAAEQGPAFGLRPVGGRSLTFLGDAGATVHGAVAVSNTGDAAGTVKLFPADAATGAATGIVYLTDSPPAGVGTWIAVGSSQLDLKPGERVEVPFTVHVAGRAGPGEYVGGIVAETLSDTTNSIRARNLSIVAVQVNVPGALSARFTIGTVRIGGTAEHEQLLLHVGNDGNVVRKPQGSITISSTGGRTMETVPIHMDAFLPQTEADYPVSLAKALPPGTYVASVRLTYPGTSTGGAQMSSAAPQFTVSSRAFGAVNPPGRRRRPRWSRGGFQSSSSLWEWLAIGLGALLLAGGGYFFAVLHRRRPVTVTVTPVPPAVTAAAQIPAEPALELCAGHHYWRVDWDRGELGPDGLLLYPHRCRNCGIEVKATDIGDAAAKVAELSTAGARLKLHVREQRERHHEQARCARAAATRSSSGRAAHGCRGSTPAA